MNNRNITKLIFIALTTLALFTVAAPAQEKQASLSDETIKSIVERRIAKLDLKNANVTVTVAGGVVTLSGTVRSDEELARAIQLAVATDGVQRVVSTVQKKPITP